MKGSIFRFHYQSNINISQFNKTFQFATASVRSLIYITYYIVQLNKHGKVILIQYSQIRFIINRIDTKSYSTVLILAISEFCSTEKKWENYRSNFN